MLDNILEATTQLKTFIMVSAIGMLVVGVILLISCRKFAWNSRNRRTIGFFYAMDTWDIFGLSSCMLKLFLAISFLVGKGLVEFLHIVIFIVLELCYILYKHKLKGLLADIGLAVVSVIVMVIMQLLYNYLHDIIFDMKVCVIMWMLAILLCLYELYDVYSCCNHIVSKYKTKG